MLWIPNPPMIPSIIGNIMMFVFFVLMLINAMVLVDTIWMSVLINPLPMMRFMIWRSLLCTILFTLYRIFSTILNHNPTKIHKNIRLFSLRSLLAKNTLVPAEYFIYSSAYTEISVYTIITLIPVIIPPYAMAIKQSPPIRIISIIFWYRFLKNIVMRAIHIAQ